MCSKDWPHMWVQAASLLSTFAHLTFSASPSACAYPLLPAAAFARQSMSSEHWPHMWVQAALLFSSCAHLTFSVSPGCTSGCPWPHSLAAALATERCSGVRPSSSKEPSMLLKKRWLLWIASRAAFSFAGCLGTSRLQAGQVRGVDRVTCSAWLVPRCRQPNADLLTLHIAKAAPDALQTGCLQAGMHRVRQLWHSACPQADPHLYDSFCSGRLPSMRLQS